MPTTLPRFYLRMPAAHHFTSPTRSLVLRLLSLSVFFVLPTTMPPLSGHEKFQDAGQIISNFKQSRLLQAFLVVLATATVILTVVIYISQRQSRTIDASIDTSEKPMIKPLLERQDSATCHNQWESDHKNYLNSLKLEILKHTEEPILPWVSPPQALPGPYDPMYYPLPAPSFRCKTSESLAANVEGRHSAFCTRLVPKFGTPLGEAALYGTMTTSTHGWRRSHWNVTGG
ncbi:uncharacterized protein M421DRAFT_191636 [Didymella exigua CBS 183.55]|uniref:Uncharacterized protein n=1 Tax=Didymella exigua CBS 183.55 TaxID=1150837 RepID=A0A6A5S076_9PLEO|nr:uncharacterized protein M421DRAFT_191636 [Didymella exigua CBS 183.55]KAF1933199.1 hypothetical protein M421DRAFT_191636 [Didymella exigua CBS 183.55]